jgi:transcription termination/antitermination protein NusA
VQSVSNELAGERVDIILWNENPAQFVVNAMSPAEVTSIVVDEDAHSMNIAVEEDKLAMAIGRGGQNVRLASELTGWELNVMTEKEAEERSEEENHHLVETFKVQLDVDAELAEILVAEGFSTIEEVAYVPESELEAIEEFDADIVIELRNRARDYLLTQAIMQEEILEEHKPAEDLLSMEGMDEETAMHLAGLGVCTMEDLAEQSVDELMVIDDMDEERASTLIMKAREPWFAAENQ